MNTEFYKKVEAAYNAVEEICDTVSAADCNGGKCPFGSGTGVCLLKDIQSTLVSVSDKNQ